MVGVIVAAGVSLAWAVVAPRSSLAHRIVDAPDGFLKLHDRPIPPIGGIGVFLGLQIGLAVEGRFDAAFLAGGAIVLVLGLVDDLRSVPPLVRLGAETVGGLVLLASPHLDVGAPEGVIVVVAVLVAVNGLNLVDGMDGLAGSVSVISAIGLAIAYRGIGPLVLAAAIAGFLVRNRPPARLFLGDNGAYVVGLSLVYLAARSGPGAGSTVVGLAMLGVVLLDLGVTVLRRARARRELFAGDRSHVYDQLGERGMPVSTVVLVAAGSQVVIVGAVVAGTLIAGDPGGIVAGVVLGAVMMVALWMGGFVTPR